MNPPWSEREAEAWANEWRDLYSSVGDFEEFGQQEAFHASLKRASEFIAKQANQEFDEASAEIAARKWVDGFYPNRFDDHGDYNQFVGFCVYGMRWQHARDFATIEALETENRDDRSVLIKQCQLRDAEINTQGARIAELEKALTEMADLDNPNELKYIGHPTCEYMRKAREALKVKA